MNGIESFWVLLSIMDIHNISKKYLQRHVNEFSHRLNVKEASTEQFIGFACKHGLGKVRPYERKYNETYSDRI